MPTLHAHTLHLQPQASRTTMAVVLRVLAALQWGVPPVQDGEAAVQRCERAAAKSWAAGYCATTCLASCTAYRQRQRRAADHTAACSGAHSGACRARALALLCAFF